MKDDDLQRRITKLSVIAGPGATRFAEYLASEFAACAYRAALDVGMMPLEAEMVERVTLAGAMKSFASAVKQVKWDRQFRKGA